MSHPRYHSIRVSKGDLHFRVEGFLNEAKVKEALELFLEKMPVEEGFNYDVCLWKSAGHQVPWAKERIAEDIRAWCQPSDLHKLALQGTRRRE